MKSLTVKALVFLIIINILFLLTAIPVAAVVNNASIVLDGAFNDWNDKPGLADSSADDSNPMTNILMVKWFPSNTDSYLYLYCEREGGYVEDKSDLKKNNNEGENNNDTMAAESETYSQNNKGSQYFDEAYDPDMTSDNEVLNDMQNNYTSRHFKFQYWYFTVHFSSPQGNSTAYVLYHPPSRKVLVVLDGINHNIWIESGKWGDDKYIAKRVEFRVPISPYIVSRTTGGYSIDMHIDSGLLSVEDRTPDSGEITISSVSTFPIANVTVLTITMVLPCTAAFYYKKRRISGIKDREN